jgi:nucleoside 2-deoxyribosyltransferase
MNAPADRRPAVYLAGPGVFRPDAAAFAAHAKARCAAFGLEGLHPFDGALPPGLAGRALGLAISAANETLIARADAVVADISPYHGPSCDVGTAFEIGFARARGLPIFAYTAAKDRFEARVIAFLGGEDSLRPRADGSREGPDGMQIEAFDLVDNLMLDGGILASGGTILEEPDGPEVGLETALAACAAWFAGRGPRASTPA